MSETRPAPTEPGWYNARLFPGLSFERVRVIGTPGDLTVQHARSTNEIPLSAVHEWGAPDHPRLCM